MLALKTIIACQTIQWQKHNLKHFEDFKHLITKVHQENHEDGFIGEWFYIDEPNKVIYCGYWSDDSSLDGPGNIFSTAAEIFYNNEDFQKGKHYWLCYDQIFDPEWN